MALRTSMLLARYAKSTQAVSAVEFALVFPTLLILMLFGTQLIAYVNAVRKIETLATSMSEMISQAVPPNYSTTVALVNQLDLHFAYDAGLVIFPYLMKDGPRQNLAWWQDITITFASVQFVANGKDCSSTTDKSACYVANVVWTSTGTFGSNARPCTVPQIAASNTAPPSKSTLPTSIFGPGSIIVVDVVFNFKPVFASRYMPALKIARSVYVQPRYATLINYDLSNSDGIATRCPGY